MNTINTLKEKLNKYHIIVAVLIIIMVSGFIGIGNIYSGQIEQIEKELDVTARSLDKVNEQYKESYSEIENLQNENSKLEKYKTKYKKLSKNNRKLTKSNEEFKVNIQELEKQVQDLQTQLNEMPACLSGGHFLLESWIRGRRFFLKVDTC